MLEQQYGIYKLKKILKYFEKQETTDIDLTKEARDFIEKQYQKRTGRNLNLENPTGFNEKLQWMKLYWRDEKASYCANKVSAREYVRRCGLEKYLNPLLAVWKSAEEIDFAGLPDAFMIKAAHASGLNLIVQDKNRLSVDEIRAVFGDILKLEYHRQKGEWVYRREEPALICEALYSNYEKGQLDYKFFCFNGKVRCIQVLTATDTTDLTDDTTAFFCDENLQALPVQCGYAVPTEAPKRPACLEEMKQAAEKLSKGFPFVRVDFCVDNGRPWFGEFTFFPGAGYDRYEPFSFELKMGEWLDLGKAYEQRDKA